MIVTKFHKNRLTIDQEINEKHAILVDPVGSHSHNPMIYNYL